MGWSGAWPLEVVARGDRVRVGNLVVDAHGGNLVGVAPPLWQVTGAERAVVDGRELVVLDTLSGEVLSRAQLSDGLPDGPLWDAHRGRGASLLQYEAQGALVADDGSLVATIDGGFLSYVDRAVGDPVAFPVRGPISESELNTPLRLVRADTGEVVVDFPEPMVRVADVHGDLAMVATTDASIDLYHSPPVAEDVVWSVVLLDARTGEERARVTAISREPPRLLGTFSDGTAVVTTRVGDEYPLLAVTAPGDVSTIAQVGRRSDWMDAGFIVESTALTAAGLADDVLVVSDGDGQVRGLDRSGDRLWQLDVPWTAGVRAGDGHVALYDDEDGRIQLVQAADGEVVATLQPPDDDWMVGEVVGIPMGVVEEHVGISRSGHYLTPNQGPLVDTTWLHLRTGETGTLDDVFRPFAGDAEPVGQDWVFHGVVPDELGEPEPVVSRMQPPNEFELLEPGDGFRTYELPLPPTQDVPAFGVVAVGASADHFAARREGGHSPLDLATIVLDRTTGTPTTIGGVSGIGLFGGLLLAEEVDESYAVTATVAVDPATGEERWRSEPHARFPGQEFLRVDDELVIDTGMARVTATGTQDGTRRWTHPTDVVLSGDVVLGPSHVVVATTDGQLLALDRRDGTVAWRTALGVPVASLTGAGDHVLVGTHHGLVIHLDGRGREVQRIAVGTGSVHEVAALGETVVAIVDDRVIGLRTDGNGITRDDEVELP